MTGVQTCALPISYSVLDTGSAITDDVTAKLSAIDGVIKVRVVK